MATGIDTDILRAMLANKSPLILDVAAGAWFVRGFSRKLTSVQASKLFFSGHIAQEHPHARYALTAKGIRAAEAAIARDAEAALLAAPPVAVAAPGPAPEPLEVSPLPPAPDGAFRFVEPEDEAPDLPSPPATFAERVLTLATSLTGIASALSVCDGVAGGEAEADAAFERLALEAARLRAVVAAEAVLRRCPSRPSRPHAPGAARR